MVKDMFKDQQDVYAGEPEMFEKILYPTDFSEYAENLAGALDELTKVGLKEAVLVHIVDFRSGKDGQRV